MQDAVLTFGEYTYQVIHVKEHGVTRNERFFVGPLPQVGDAVEMVLVGTGIDGEMKFQLRTKARWVRSLTSFLKK